MSSTSLVELISGPFGTGKIVVSCFISKQLGKQRKRRGWSQKVGRRVCVGRGQRSAEHRNSGQTTKKKKKKKKGAEK